MKKILSIALTAAMLCTTGCQNWLDINVNPNYVGEADMQYLLPSAELYLAQEVGYNISLYGHFWSQYVNQNANTNQYYTIMTYDVTNSSWTRVWSNLYSKVLPTVKEIKTKALAAENSSNYLLQAYVLEAYTFYMLTSLYEGAAYSEGYIKTNYSPTFDSGTDMQKNLISMFENIRTLDPEEVEESEILNSTASYDMVFGGDNDAWFQFANTLYLKVLLRDFNANKTKIQELLAEDNFLAEDAAFDHFLDQADKSNPLYENDRRQLNTADNIRACSDILNVLDADDPRIEYYYDNFEDVTLLGMEYGMTTKPSESGRLRLEATDPVYFGTADEAEFLKAEAYARLGQTGDAQTAYNNALDYAFLRTVGESAGDYISEGGSYEFNASATAENMVEQIINQKWASNVRALAIESWFDLNRTGYPTRGTTIADYSGVLKAGSYPRRFIYGKNSADYNPNTPEPVAVDVKMWWHK